MRGDRGATALQVVGLVAVAGVGVGLLGLVLSGAATDLGPVLMFLLVPAVLVAALLYQRHRVKVTRQWAARAGWTYVGSDRSLTSRWRGTPFGVGRSRRTSEVVTGPFGARSATSFAYRYTTGSGKHRSTTTYHVVVLHLPTYLPSLELTPDRFGAKLAKAFGGQDIVFESAEFNRAWRVEARDMKFAHDVINPRLMERLLRADATGMSMRIEGSDIVCWTLGAPRLDAVAPRLQVLSAVAEAIPRFVWLDHGYDPATT